MFRPLVMTLFLWAAPAYAAVNPSVQFSDLPSEQSLACGALRDIVGNVLLMRQRGISEMAMKMVMWNQMAAVNRPTEDGTLSPQAQAWIRDANTAIRFAAEMSREEAASAAGVRAMFVAVGRESQVLAVTGGAVTCAL